jgi:hypothetical protein
MLGRLFGLILFGLAIGGLGRLVRPGPNPISIWLTIGIGLAASIVAGLLIPGVLGFILAVGIATVLVGAVGTSHRGRLGRGR